MQILSLYLLIGALLVMAACEINKIPSYDDSEPEVELTNSDRIVYILFWPAIIIYVIYKLKKE